MPDELTLTDLIFTALSMLIGVEDEDFCYYQPDAEWWELRLYSRIN